MGEHRLTQTRTEVLAKLCLAGQQPWLFTRRLNSFGLNSQVSPHVARHHG